MTVQMHFDALPNCMVCNVYKCSHYALRITHDQTLSQSEEMQHQGRSCGGGQPPPNLTREGQHIAQL